MESIRASRYRAYLAVGAFRARVREPGSDEGHNAIEVLADSACHLPEGVEPGVGGPGVPLFELLAHDIRLAAVEVLLAAPDALRKRLGAKERLTANRRHPVEDQNGSQPPKKIVQDLFRRYLKRAYDEAFDAPHIVSRAMLGDIVRDCAQCFAPFVNEIRTFSEGHEPEPDGAAVPPQGPS